MGFLDEFAFAMFAIFHAHRIGNKLVYVAALELFAITGCFPDAGAPFHDLIGGISGLGK